MTVTRNLPCKTNPVQRARGGNAVAAAAYRAGQNLRDEASQQMHRYGGRSRDVEGSIIISSPDAPEWHQDRAALWNSIEARETRKDARTGRDLVLGLAWELAPEERREAVLEFAQKEFVDRGYVVDVAFHKYGAAVREGDRVFDHQKGEHISGAERIDGWRDAGLPFLEAHQIHDVDMPHVKIERRQGGGISGYKIYHPHAHVLSSPRAWDSETGDWATKKDPYFNKAETAMNWRYEWPKLQNQYLGRAGWDVRVSCTASDGDDQLPTKSESLDNRDYHIERRGEQSRASEQAAFNGVHNDAIRQAAAEQATPAVEEEEHAPEAVPDDLSAVHAETRMQASADVQNDAAPEQPNRMHRFASWWQNMNQSFADWRGTMRERASETWERIRAGPKEEEAQNSAPRPEEPKPDHEQDR